MANKDQGYIDYQSLRARKSRIYCSLNRRLLLIAIKLSLMFSFLLAVYAYVIHNVLWGVFASSGILFGMILVWFYGDLSRLNIATNSMSQKVDQLLDVDILGRMSPGNTSAWAVYKAIENLPARHFFTNRFILPSQLFEHGLSKDPGSSNVVWRQAEALRSKCQKEYYTQEIIMGALIKAMPLHEEYLNRLRLDYQDIISGIGWMDNLRVKHLLARQAKNFGGVARDWTFGYTPVLQRFGHNVTKEIEAYGFFEDTELHQPIVASMINYMSNNVRSLALVGEQGAGKMTVVYAFAERILEPGVPVAVQHNQVMLLDAASIVAQARHPGQVEQMIIQMVNEAQSAKNIILFFDKSELFFKTGIGAADLSNLFMQFVGATVSCIFTFTPKAWQDLQINSGSVASRLQAINLPEPSQRQSTEILQSQILHLEAKHKVTFTYPSIKEAYTLAKRYEDALAMPGAGLKVLEGAVAYAEHGYITDITVQKSLEASRGVKLQTATNKEASNLLQLEQELSRYVISQKRGIKVISNALRRARSGVGSKERPVGTFLFLGPTGVGKTELSKALARVYYGDIESIVRIDMNQYVSPDDITRLISVENNGDQLSFLGQVKNAPFSVILLDEIEKAHPSVLYLLLQMLDEGVMKDSNNKQVSFKDAIIIATSNAGADSIRSMVKSGSIAAKDAVTKITEQLIAERIFAPEFINRFDEVVLFEPLAQDDLIEVMNIIIADINHTLERQKVRVMVDSAARHWLIAKGYDPMLGARPIRRIAQKYIENIVAKKILSGLVVDGGVVTLTIADFEAEDA